MDRRIVGGLVCCLALGCAAKHTTLGGPACLLTEKPTLPKQSIARHLVGVTLRSPVKAVARHAPSANLVDGQVPDSSFFTNRRISDLTPEAIRRGPSQPGQEPQPPFVVTKLKGEGKTAGFFAKDAKGDRYLMKLDLPDYPELLTGAEAVTSRLMFALGYHVPSYDVVEFSVSQLTLAPDGRVSRDEVDEMLEDRVTDGRLRVCASRLLEGEVLGPFRFQDYRHLTELRGLRLAYAWINNTDAKDHNSLMVWTGDRAVGYLIDFGTTLGADAKRGPKRPCQGWLNDVDVKNMTLEVVTLTMHRSGCDVPEPSVSATIGRFSPRLDPARWKPYAPNLAFDAMTSADAHWMARRLAQFSRAQIEAAVDAGRYSRPEDARAVVDVLEVRRHAILHAYLPQPTLLAQPSPAPPSPHISQESPYAAPGPVDESAPAPESAP
jgi:hypothetical protein